MAYVLAAEGLIDPCQLEGLTDFIWVFDTSLNNGGYLLEFEIKEGQFSKCSLFIAFGPEAEAFEEIVDDYLIELDGAVFFPTVSETSIDELVSLVSGWRSAKDKNIVLHTASAALRDQLRQVA